MRLLLKLIIFTVLLSFSFHGKSTEVLEIKINTDTTLTSFTFISKKHGYEANNVFISEKSRAIVKIEGGKIAVHKNGTTQLFNEYVLLKRKNWGAQFSIIAKGFNSSDIFPDNLLIKIENNHLTLINIVYIDHYVAGVVEAEAGSKQNNEYYKLQSVICRTYALSNLRRHEEEKFNLCNQVHCQVYRGIPRYNFSITKSTYATKGLVLVDSTNKLITATFHSNCGGQTANSEDVWTYSLDYLRSVCDTFCTDQHHASWNAEIPKEEWLNYFKNQYNYPIENTSMRNLLLTNRINNRKDIIADTFHIRAKDIRKDWDLKSAYFDISNNTNSVFLSGFGFGHGVGLCQEGAMKMSQQNISYKDILNHYFKNTLIKRLDQIDL